MSGPNTTDESEIDNNQSTVTVSVSSSGRVTIPEQVLDTLDINAPGQVMFYETQEGEVVIKRVPSAAEMEGFAARHSVSSTKKPASELLREKREAGRAHRDTE